MTIVVPGELEARTGGYEYDRRMIRGLRASGWTVDVERLHDSFPFPNAAAREHAEAALAAIPDGRTVLFDGLALGVLPDETARHAARLKLVALVHHPLATETGLDAPVAAALQDSERRALAAVGPVVVTSRATAAALAPYGVAASRIHVVEPGTDPAPLARGSSRPDPQAAVRAGLALLCVATLTPRKGHALLLRALASLGDVPWRLTCAGSLDRDSATTARVRALIRECGLDDRVAFVGDLDAAALAVEYDRADMFVLATLHEGYGMAVAEALARGLPVVSTTTGAIEELVGTRAGLLAPPGDLAALATALSRALRDVPLREQLADGARQARLRLPTWDAAVAAMGAVLDLANG